MAGSPVETVKVALFGSHAGEPNHIPFSPMERDILLDCIAHFKATDEGFRRAAQRITTMAKTDPSCTHRYMYECREAYRRHLGANHNPNGQSSYDHKGVKGDRRGRFSRRADPKTEEFDG